MKILIVEDQPLFADLIQAAISSVPGMVVVGIVTDGESALLQCQELQPDAVLMDIELPGDLDGIETALEIRKALPTIGVVFLSAHMEPGILSTLPNNLRSGWAYLLKQSVPDLDTVVRAIDGSSRGMVVLDPLLIQSMNSQDNSQISRLPRRHQEILELVAEGFSNAAVARKLSLSEKTVETYMTSIYQELGLSDEPDIHLRVKATALYLQNT